jgi:hypothetical protein
VTSTQQPGAQAFSAAECFERSLGVYRQAGYPVFSAVTQWRWAQHEARRGHAARAAELEAPARQACDLDSTLAALDGCDLASDLKSYLKSPAAPGGYLPAAPVCDGAAGLGQVALQNGLLHSACRSPLAAVDGIVTCTWKGARFAPPPVSLTVASLAQVCRLQTDGKVSPVLPVLSDRQGVAQHFTPGAAIGP